MRQHIGLCPRIESHGWLTLLKETEWTVTGVSLQSLEGLVQTSLTKLQANPHANFTFSSERNAQAVIESPLEEQPTALELCSLLPGSSITFLCPIGSPHYPDLWAQVWRDPRGGLSTLSKGRFVSRMLFDEVGKWFAFYNPKKIEYQKSIPLELWVRQDWSAASMFPEEEFPAPKPLPVRTKQEVDHKKQAEKLHALKRQNESQQQSQGRTFNEKTRSWGTPD